MVKKLWTILFVISVGLMIAGWIYLPSPLTYDDRRPPTDKHTLLAQLSFLFLAVNALLYWVSHIKPESGYWARLNYPNKKYWLETPEKKMIMIGKIKRMMAVLGSYVNFLVGSMLYTMIQYYYPYTLPCPRHLLLLMVWVILTVVVGVHMIVDAFRR